MCIYNIVTYPIKLSQKKTSPQRHPEFALEAATLLPALDLGLLLLMGSEDFHGTLW
jgi:hypothetical protein